jgi:hydrogenase expression/formation protein HypE
MTSPRLRPGKIPGDLLGALLSDHAVTDDRILLGPGTGHDSAAIAFGDTALVIKTDPITFPTDRAAHHLIHINANDIACQGAIPKWLLVTALLPQGTTTTESVRDLFAEVNEAAASIGVTVIGGHTEVTFGLDRPILVGTMLGEVAVDRLVRPTAAMVGDRLLVTQSAGIEGTAILASMATASALDPDVISRARAYLDDPGISVLVAARALHDAGAISAMHDPTEGGIATAVREMALAAGTGVVISRSAVPVSPETALLASAYGIDPLGLLSSGSLLATVPKDRMETAERALQSVGIPFSWIGKLTDPAAGMRLRNGMTDEALPEFAVDELARVLGEDVSS